MRVRIVARFKNEHFIEAREQAGFPTQAEMSRVTGIAQMSINKYENFRDYPRSKEMKKRVELATGCLFEEMFPKLYRDAVDRKLGRPIQRVLTLRELPEWTAPHLLEQSPENLYDLKELKERILGSFETLTDREADALRMRHGIDCPERTLEEMGERLGVTKERARQIWLKALRKLKRNPELRPFASVGWQPPDPPEKERQYKKKAEDDGTEFFNMPLGQYMGTLSLTEKEKIERAQACIKDYLKNT